MWRDLSATPRTSSFCRRFAEAADYCGVRIVPVVADQGVCRRVDSLLSHDPGTIRQLVDSFGGRCAGSLIVGQSWTYWDHALGEQRLTSWIRTLTEIGKPVVWWDLVDEVGGKNSPPFLEAFMKLFRVQFVRERFFRCYADQYRAAKTVVDILIETGHTHAELVAGPFEEDEWCRRRISNLFEAGSQRRPQKLHIVCRSKGQEFSDEDRALVGGLGGRGPSFGIGATHSAKDPRYLEVENRLERIIHLSRRIFDPIMIRKDGLAVICINDDIARFAGYWLRQNRIPVPDAFSLVSFDADHSRLYPFTFSSLDMNFGRLGYQAFQTILGGLGAFDAKRIDIVSDCRLNHELTIVYGRNGESHR